MYVIILAGGEGMRLRPCTENTPKPMLMVAGKPILEWQIRQFQAAGVTAIKILENYKAHIIQEYFQDGASLGVKIEHLQDPASNVGTSQIVKVAVQDIPDSEDVLVIAGDLLNTVNINELAKFHQQKNKNISVVGERKQLQFGMFEVDDNSTVLSVKEKPWVDVPSALMIIKREVFDQIPNEGDFFKNLEPIIQESGALYKDSNAILLHVSETKNDLLYAEDAWNSVIASTA